MELILKKDGALAVVRSLGGELISYKKDDKEYVWTGDEKYWTGRAPALFPFVSALKDGKSEIDGKECVMKPKHGFIRTSELNLVSSSESSAVFELTDSPETLANYPYKFAFRITHTLNSDGFTTTYTVENTDTRPIEFCIGAHPGFFLPNGIENYKLVFENEENSKIHYTDKDSLYSDDYIIDKELHGREWELKYDDFDVDALFFTDVKGKKVSIVSKDGKKHIDFDFTGFETLVVWTPPKKHAPFLCLEPWNGLPAYVNETGKFSDKPYLITLPVGKQYSVSYKVTI